MWTAEREIVCCVSDSSGKPRLLNKPCDSMSNTDATHFHSMAISWEFAFLNHIQHTLMICLEIPPYNDITSEERERKGEGEREREEKSLHQPVRER